MLAALFLEAKSEACQILEAFADDKLDAVQII